MQNNLRNVVRLCNTENTIRKGNKMTTTTQTYSFKEYIENLGGLAPYSFLCDCKACKNKQMVKVAKESAPQLLEMMGLPDEMTPQDLEIAHHLIVQELGKDKI